MIRTSEDYEREIEELKDYISILEDTITDMVNNDTPIQDTVYKLSI